MWSGSRQELMENFTCSPKNFQSMNIREFQRVQKCNYSCLVHTYHYSFTIPKGTTLLGCQQPLEMIPWQ